MFASWPIVGLPNVRLYSKFSSLQRTKLEKDIALVRNMGFEVDDDNEPAPENVPGGNAPPVNGGALLEGQEWGWDGIDRRAMLQGSMYNGSTFTNEWSPNGKSFSEIFLHCFPCFFLEVTIVEATNNVLLTVNVVQTT